MVHAARVNQCAFLVGPQIGRAKGFDIVVGRQRGRDQRVAAVFQRRRRIDLHQNIALQVEQQDFVVDRVLVAVFAQPVADRILLIGEAGDETAEFPVGGKEADIGGAFK